MIFSHYSLDCFHFFGLKNTNIHATEKQKENIFTAYVIS